MECTLINTGGSRHTLKVTAGAEFAEADKGCPKCEKGWPLLVYGGERHIASRDTYRAVAYAGCCDHVIGTIEAKVETIFGLEEDEAMLVHGRARVYGGELRR